MKSRTAPFVLSVLVLLSTGAMGSDKDDVIAVFAKYKKAIQSDDGKSAVDLVDDTTIKWYSDAISDALKVEKAALLRMKFINKFTIMRLRLDFSKEELAKMTGRDLFILSIEKGWTSKEGTEQIEINHVAFDKELAQAFVKDEPRFPAFYFMRSNNVWKFALWKSFAMADAAMSQAAKQQGQTEEEFILATLKVLSKFKVDESLYDPPK